MLKGPQGQKRPADVSECATKVARIVTGDEEEILTKDGKNAAAVSLGKLGGKARAEALSKRQRSDIARKAAEGRWRKEH